MLHRKLAVIDANIVWEGSLNILSQARSAEFMRRIVSFEIASQTLKIVLNGKGWYTMNRMSNYEITDKDVQAIVKFLQINDPENASEDNAISFLLNVQSGLHDLALENPGALLKLYNQTKKAN